MHGSWSSQRYLPNVCVSVLLFMKPYSHNRGNPLRVPSTPVGLGLSGGTFDPHIEKANGRMTMSPADQLSTQTASDRPCQRQALRNAPSLGLSPQTEAPPHYSGLHLVYAYLDKPLSCLSIYSGTQGKKV